MQTFLAAHGWADADRSSVAGDAGGRRYYRLRQRARSAILVDGSDDGPMEPFLRIARWLRGIGLHAPEILAADPVNRLALIEDLGDAVVSHVVWSAEEETTIYENAAEAIARMQAVLPPDRLPIMSDDRLIEIVSLFLEIETPGIDEAARQAFVAIWRDLLPLCRIAPAAFLHRDYHSPNLVWIASASGLARLGILDFQDAFVGPPAYDLVSLIDDPRRDVGPQAASAAIDHYLTCRPDIARDGLAVAMDILGAQRALRILAVFTRLARLGKPSYTLLRPRVKNYLDRRTASPVMTPLRLWLERHAR